jgi:hypothetical protein
LAGWDAVGVDGFAVSPEGVWCGGGDGAVRRY